MPRPRVGRRGDASSPCGKTRRHLPARANEALPHPYVGRRGDASPSSPRGKTRQRLALPCRKTRRRLVSLTRQGDASFFSNF
ncbi:hypothetical protein BHM03_00039990 [Ensete ventricosum]|nr:hypothetical protein BHM03_00039990 [Ensete ventricosum]